MAQPVEQQNLQSNPAINDGADIEKQKFEFALHLLERTDTLRASGLARSSFILTADTFLLAGITFLVDKGLSANISLIVLFIFAFINYLCVISSLLLAVHSITSIWSKSTIEGEKRFFFHLSDTINEFKCFHKYEEHFRVEKDKTFTTYALSENWRQMHLHDRQIKYFRPAVIMFTISAMVFTISVIVYIVFQL